MCTYTFIFEYIRLFAQFHFCFPFLFFFEELSEKSLNQVNPLHKKKKIQITTTITAASLDVHFYYKRIPTSFHSKDYYIGLFPVECILIEISNRENNPKLCQFVCVSMVYMWIHSYKCRQFSKLGSIAECGPAYSLCTRIMAIKYWGMVIEIEGGQGGYPKN